MHSKKFFKSVESLENSNEQRNMAWIITRDNSNRSHKMRNRSSERLIYPARSKLNFFSSKIRDFVKKTFIKEKKNNAENNVL